LEFFKPGRLSEKLILLGILFIIVMGVLSHFLFGWFNENYFIALISPINESVWEHLKLVFYPTVTWWIIGYFIALKKTDLNIGRWFFCSVISVFVASVFIMSFYYVMKGAFEIESVVLHIISFIIGVILGQISALLFYRNVDFRRGSVVCTVLALLILSSTFSVFTFNPPQFPLFCDQRENIYGIDKKICK